MRGVGKKARMALVGAAGSIAVLLGLVSLAHTPAGRPLMRVLRGAACPIDFTTPLSAEASEAGRQRALVPFRGEKTATARPALGFALGETTHAEVVAWADAHGLACKADGPATLTCRDVPAGALPAPHDAAATSVSLRWNPSDRLVAVVTTRAGLDAASATRMASAIADDVERSAGPPTRTVGEPTASWLDASFKQYRAEFGYRNYRAEVLASRIGDSILVNEEYQAID
jgi:hypothetical protein